MYICIYIYICLYIIYLHICLYLSLFIYIYIYVHTCCTHFYLFISIFVLLWPSYSCTFGSAAGAGPRRPPPPWGLGPPGPQGPGRPPSGLGRGASAESPISDNFVQVISLRKPPNQDLTGYIIYLYIYINIFMLNIYIYIYVYIMWTAGRAAWGGERRTGSTHRGNQ